MQPLVVIPARGGSKGIPRKNIKKLGGKPLIYYTIEAAREVFQDDHILVSTDDQEIKQIVEKTGLKVPFIRPSKLATDKSGIQEVLNHAIEFSMDKGYSPDTLILLQPTSPFRKGIHIKEALELYRDSLDMVVSVKETKANPYYVLFEENDEGYLRKSKEADITRRQDAPKVWEYNGAIYIINIASFYNVEIKKLKKIKKYKMDYVSSIDIDDELDFRFAEFLINES